MCLLQMVEIGEINVVFAADDRDLRIVLVGKDCYSNEELLSAAQVTARLNLINESGWRYIYMHFSLKGLSFCF